MTYLTPEQLTGQDNSHIHYFSEHLGVHHALVKPWHALVSAAKQAGFNLTIASGFRSFERQLAIWNNKYNGITPIKDIENQIVNTGVLNELEKIHAIMLFSALPGASRHHFGSDIDIYDPALLAGAKLQLEPWEYQDNGPMAELSHWLDEHCQEYGFFKPYKHYQQGVAAEPWHLSFKPLANNCQRQLTPDVLKSCYHGKPLAGKDTITKHLTELFNQYINNIC
jgi:LAS superfamily LD-carboxypeptidase LdcB